MKATFIADFYTDGDFGFDDFDNLFDKNNSMYEGAEVKYINVLDGEHIYIRLQTHGEANACRWAVRDLLEKLMCSIRTHKHYLVRQVYDSLYYFHDGLWEDVNQDKDICMSGNYDGTYLALHMRED